MKFDSYFRLVSFATVAAGAVTLFVSGGFGIALALGFVALLVLAWHLEGTKWQLPERVALVIVIFSIPLFYLDWKLQLSVNGEDERVGVTALTHLILFLSAVKLIQVKADRDWIFLYLISFFEVLLAAGLSLSPAFLASLTLYLVCALSTIIAFEIRKAGRVVHAAETRLLVSPESGRLRRLLRSGRKKSPPEIRRLPWVTAALLIVISILALPLFFAAPRFTGSAFSRSGGGLTGFVGFSDSVTLGDIGRLQQVDRVVMRVRVEGAHADNPQALRWRGVALDEYTGRGWKNSRSGNPKIMPGVDKTFFPFDTIESLPKLTVQTFFLEPLDTNILFAAPRALAVQGGLPVLRIDGENALSTRSHESSRLTYKVYSDTSIPDPSLLRKDLQHYPEDFKRYLELPEIDGRIYGLSARILSEAQARNRYDAAKAIESYLRDPRNFSYTLDLKAGGKDPLADFLFNIRAGHCEYFATAMAVMLRTQGIATRVVNGFQTGLYNDTADVYTVSQKDAHSWVEVYFPGTGKWVTFDPTPANAPENVRAGGFTAQLSKYAEALQVLWAEYFVGYDRQEQRSLATSLRSRISESRISLGSLAEQIKGVFASWFKGDDNQRDPNAPAWKRVPRYLVMAVFLAALVWLGFQIRKTLQSRTGARARGSVVEFYDRMIRLLESRGLVRSKDQTPLEFARTLGRPEALLLTVAYNNVRFGARTLSANESVQIEQWLESLAVESTNTY
jgi:protein-glutamine gamma-glutamyltransferase